MKFLFCIQIFIVPSALYASDLLTQAHGSQERIVALQKELIRAKSPLFDAIEYKEIAPNLVAIKEALKIYVGQKFHTLPPDSQILADIEKALAYLPTLLFFPLVDISQYRLGLQKLNKPLPETNYQEKWQEVTQSPNFHPDFFEDLYHALASPEVMELAQFPDPTDAALNDSLQEKVNYLIVLLASIKSRADNRQLTPEIKAEDRARVAFPTSGHSEMWFYEKKYKLYKIWENLPALSLQDKAALLSNLLHGGRHCSVAKRWQIDDSYRLFNFDDYKRLQEETYGASPSLQAVVEQILADEKHKVLTEAILSAVSREKAKAALDRRNGQETSRFGEFEFETESATFVDATWDLYAHNFGFAKRHCLYSSYALQLDAQKLFGPGGYTPKRLVERVAAEAGDKILEHLLGVIRFVVKDPSAFILSYLNHKGYILEPSSPLAAAKLTEYPAGLSSLQAAFRPAAPSFIAPMPSREVMVSSQTVEDRFRFRYRGSTMTSRFGRVDYGHMTHQHLLQIREQVASSMFYLNSERVNEIKLRSLAARNEDERLVALATREYIILVDQSGSMVASDRHPSGQNRRDWTRWNSVGFAVESIAELVFTLDQDRQLPIMFWSGGPQGLRKKMGTAKRLAEVPAFFQSAGLPHGTTPLTEALEAIYHSHLQPFIERQQACTVIILTDGAPDNPQTVKEFFQKIAHNNGLASREREGLIRFSFVQIGDDHAATRFLEDLDDNLIREMHLGVDMVDTTTDQFLFGTGEYQGKKGVGPFALIWKALFDILTSIFG